MISASHNPYEDNGIKLFGPDGLKLSDAQEAGDRGADGGRPHASAWSRRPGSAAPRRLEDAPGRYIEAVKQSFPRRLTLEGLRIVVDCAHGAAYRVAPTVLWELGAEVVPLGVAPDGFNINKGCGSTSPAQLAELVRERRADLGIALDGDADRVVLVDEAGPDDRRRPDPRPDRRCLEGRRAPARRRGGGDRDVQHGAGALPARIGRSACSAPPSATAMSARRCARWAAISAASSPAT